MSASVAFIIKKFVTMHGHMNVKFPAVFFSFYFQSGWNSVSHLHIMLLSSYG